MQESHVYVPEQNYKKVEKIQVTQKYVGKIPLQL